MRVPRRTMYCTRDKSENRKKRTEDVNCSLLNTHLFDFKYFRNKMKRVRGECESSCIYMRPNGAKKFD